MLAGIRHLVIVCCLVLSGALATPVAAETPVGTLGAVGSDTMAGLMLRWGERLAGQHPGLRLQLQASGSASAPTALTAGTVRIGPMSRPMSDAERAAFEARYGYPPLALAVAQDALVVVVHRHNPLAQLSRPELDAIFSETYRCGAEAGLRRWTALGVEGLAGPIVLHGRNAVSGTHRLFRREALCGGRYRPELNEHPGSAAVVAAVTRDPRAIGYAGLNHLTPGVKALALVDDDGSRHRPTPRAVQRGDYPLARMLYLYVNLPPGATLPPAERAFIDLVLSASGQAIVEELGFIPLPAAALVEQRRRLGLAAPRAETVMGSS